MRHTALLVILGGVWPLTGLAAGELPDRWTLGDGVALIWDVAGGARLPHTDHLEMTGRLVDVVAAYGADAQGNLTLTRRVVWPTLRTIPNDTHASLVRDYGLDVGPVLRVNGEPVGPERLRRVVLDGVLKLESVTGCGLSIARTLLPTTDRRVVVENWRLGNETGEALEVAVGEVAREEQVDGAYGRYVLRVSCDTAGTVTLKPGETRMLSVAFSGRLESEAERVVDGRAEEARRREYVAGLLHPLRPETPDPLLNRAFDFAKLRAAESICQTKGGLMHNPGGGGRYHAALWANDQAEYAGPFFPFLGDPGGNAATVNCYRHFARFMGPDYRPVPSSIIAEGAGTWEGAGDRGDAAMIAYGATRYCLALGNEAVARELWPSIQWCLESCRRKLTPEGVVASDSDELEGRFPAGKANLNTASLTYGALVSAAELARELGEPEALALGYEEQAAALRKAINDYFGANVEGYETYRYYDGNTVLRAWTCVPLTMGIHERAAGVVEGLFSPRLWTEDGLATEAGQITFWDRATLYALRGVFAAGDTDRALAHLAAYTKRRLVGEHVPYAVEAWPEGNQAQLSAESALYCRVVTEGLFGMRPTGFARFECAPRLPAGWDAMALRDMRAFGRRFDLEARREGASVRVTVTVAGEKVWDGLWGGQGVLTIVLPG